MVPSTRRAIDQERPGLQQDADEAGYGGSTASAPSGRKRKLSQKMLEINEEKETAALKKLDTMKKEYERLKRKAQRLKTMRSNESEDEDGNSPSSESSRLPPESEEEDDSVSSARQHKSAFESRGIFDTQLPPRKRLRREGETALLDAETSNRTPERPSPRGRSPVRTPPHARSCEDDYPQHLTSARDRARRVSSSRDTSASPRRRSTTPRSRPVHPRSHSSPPHNLHDRPSSALAARNRDSPSTHGRSSTSRSHSVHPIALSSASRNRPSLPRVSCSPPPSHISLPPRLNRSQIPRSSVAHPSAAPHHLPPPSGTPAPVALQPPRDGDPEDPPFLRGQVPSGKPKAGDYEPHVSKMIVHACHQYEVLLATEDPFPDLGLRDAWATRVWTDVCSSVQVFYKLTDRIEKIIIRRDSHARGTLRDKIRPHIIATYGFLTDGSERSKVKNIERYNRLLDRDAIEPEPVFHYKNVETRTHFGHNALVRRALQEQWFADPTGPGVKYLSQFSPWADGTYSKNLAFSEKAYKACYDRHLKQVHDWSATDADASRTVRQRLYDRARRVSGAGPVAAPQVGLSESSKDRLRAELVAQAMAEDSDSGGTMLRLDRSNTEQTESEHRVLELGFAY
ncbi:hypothetical protein C8Q73DRAFT_524943 [Cubamyces lactineus]|nr:hypothetical protein C8Q73DRAFT_524943 [Cubamyces lactineus]